MRRKGERVGKSQRDRPSHKRHRITIINDEMVRPVDASVRKSSVASAAPRLVKQFKDSSKQILVGLVRVVAAQYAETVPDTKVWSAFVKSEYMMGSFTSTMTNVDFETTFIKVPVIYERTLHRVFITFILSCSGEKKMVL